MDNAKYHRRESLGGNGPSSQTSEQGLDGKQRTLSQLRKQEIIERLLSLDVEKELNEEDLRPKKRDDLYKMAQNDKYKPPIASEEIVKR